MEQLISVQQKMFGRIARTIDNLRMIGAAKVTVILLQSSLKLLDQKWTKFEKQHQKLRAEYWESLISREYLTKDFLTQTEEVYVQQTVTLLELERNLLAAQAKEETSRY